jgi:exodeoxyribonuclease X
MFTVIDTETTGIDPAEHALVEVAAVDVVDEALRRINSSLINPQRSIPPEASAVHHITDLDVIGAPLARDAVPEIVLPDDEKIYVAHNSAFEQSFLEPYLPGAHWICTFKAAKRVWPQAPNHKNQTLRYFLNLPVERDRADQSHRAGPDAYVTAHLFLRLLREASVEQMLQWTKEPVYMPLCPIGEDKGFKDKPWAEVEVGFLRWMIDKPIDNKDAIWHAEQELKRRSAEADARISTQLNQEKADRDLYINTALTVAIPKTVSVDDLNLWWLEQAANRKHFRIVKGTPEYAKLAEACRVHKATLPQQQQTDAAA